MAIGINVDNAAKRFHQLVVKALVMHWAGHFLHICLAAKQDDFLVTCDSQKSEQ